MRKILGNILSLGTPDFKNRKIIHYALLSSIVLLQLLLGVIVYNEIFNESKLRDAEAELHISEQAQHFNDLTREDYNAAQYNLQYYIQTRDVKYLIKYNNSLDSLNANLQRLIKTAGKSDLFALHLKSKDRSGIPIKDINSIIDSLKNVNIQPLTELKREFQRLNAFNYEDILDSISVETSVSVDSIERKKLFSRIGNAIAGKVDVQKEKSNVVLTIRQGKNVSSGNLDEQLSYILKKTNEYYQKEFSNYKNRLTAIKDKDAGFLSRNNELLNYSNLLLKKYNDALVSFTNDARQKFEDQYKINKQIRIYTVIGLIIFMIIISVILILLTRMAFIYEKKLVQAKEKIQQNLSFKNKIVGMISHEIRSPLNIISIYSRTLGKQVQDKEVQDSLKSIEFTANSLTLLASQILDFSKNENKKPELNKTVFDLKNELDEILKALTSFVANNGNRLLIQNSITQHTIVYTDVVKIHQLFYNIVGNANKFTSNGTISIRLSIEETVNNALQFFVEIKDNGAGINEEDLKYIFKSYQQGEVLANVKNLGAGLGLNLCKEIVELFNGEIKVTSKKNIETIVSFNLVLDKIKPGNAE